jgi:hypothetical protein
MGRVIMNGPPDCPDGHWCPACLMNAKQRQWEQYQDEIKAGHDASGEKLKVIEWPAALTRELQAGRYRAVCGEFPGVGMIDGLCWDHVAGINPTPAAMEAPVLDTTTRLPPGLVRRRPR